MNNSILNSTLSTMQLVTFLLNSVMPIFFIIGLIVLIQTVLEFKRSLNLKNHLLQIEVNEYNGEIEAQHLMEEILKAEAENDELNDEVTALDESAVEEVLEEEVAQQEATVVEATEVLPKEKQDSKKSFKFKKK